MKRSELDKFKLTYEMHEDGLTILKEADRRIRQRVKDEIAAIRKFLVAVSLIRLTK